VLTHNRKPSIFFANEKPVRFNPYPDYNSEEWRRQSHAPHVTCKGPRGEVMEDLLVFKGRPARWPSPKFGSSKLLGLDPNICWERETRLGPYGFIEQKEKVGGEYQPLNWNTVRWHELQRECLSLNSKRFNVTQQTLQVPDSNHSVQHHTQFVAEQRTAVLLRSYTGFEYTENDKQTIRALISELALKSGGEYEVFLLVHSKDSDARIFDDAETYQSVLRANVPPEFHGITVLWNDEQVWNTYTGLKEDDERSVHNAQWLSVQAFSHNYPQFDFVWNWEMDFRFTGHHYDLLNNLAKFAKKQPRKYLWERNERWYIPEYHGHYETTFREDVASRHGDDTIWGPPSLPFINPLGPKPPVKSPKDDDYEWGVDEEADLITVSPMFDPVGSQWVFSNRVWGFSDENHASADLPRRATIVTQSRVSKQLLDTMHMENMRGNHVASEMTPQTVALLHGFKAAYAPHPVFMDRNWKGELLNNWFNPGPTGECGGQGSPMGWGRERRYQGTTWYYRAEPPNRLFNNWMGWTDTDLGGPEWEELNGRPCLPSVMLHPVKNTKPTQEDHKTEFSIGFG
jgi:hypothetical protein